MRVHNFSAGPATLPEAVLNRIRDDLPDWAGTGMAIMEISHRSREFVALAERAEANLRTLLSIPDHYRVLFMQGGATAQFAAVPLNLCAAGQRADYVVTGTWGQKAVKLGAPYVDVHVAASSQASGFTRIPDRSDWDLSTDAAYVHYTPNETIGGVEYPEIPDVGGVPLIADMSSTILSRPCDVSRFGLIYAGAQKNIGPAGLTLVIVRDDLLDRARRETPSVLHYKTMADAGSMANTPPTFTWYVAGLVFEWLLEMGGLEAIAKLNDAKQAALYTAIDNSSLYSNPVHPPHRSCMNVPFLLEDASLEARFLEQAVAAGLANLKGHRSVGGMRASLYNAMPMAGVEALIDFMQEFERSA
jgi:phosphoserine aminotransferase